MDERFELVSPFALSGDQPEAVEKLVKGFAEELVNARTIIHKYEHPNWFEESQEKIKQWQREKAEEKREEAQKTAKQSSATEDGARSRMGESRQKRKSGGRKINPNLKRFKGPND